MSKIEPILKAACKAVGLKRSEIEVGVHVVDPAKMRELNLQHRGKNKSTDVLSFPLNIKHDILYLGDIFVNQEDAKKNLSFLITHGFLHLLGYDHEKSKKDEKIMFALQDEIINNLRN